ncbi:hypothetical protein ACQCSX_00130 [Pseudarthrobacter sp. P1]|uniref:hypothetical protein n=1 Tax=Pseudarthrobacter sp. P1 TaxID=3418418 RepID=UPI003CE9A3F1
MKELEQFLHAFISALTVRRPKPGDDVSHLVDELGLRPPAAWKRMPITWVGGTEQRGASQDQQGQTLVLVLPGHPDAVGLTIGCIRVHGRLYCLECGWLYCRIVIRI